MRIGVIGCGRVLPAHLAGIRQVLEKGVAEATITALCSGHIENALMFRSPEDGITPREPAVSDPANPMSTPHVYVSQLQEHRPAVYTDYRKMLDDDVVDAALVLTQTGQHHVMALDCFGAGVHALVEKPMAITTAAGQLMVDAADRAGCVLAVAEMARHIKLHRAQHWALANGHIGQFSFALHREMGVSGRSPTLGSGGVWRHIRDRVGSNTALDLGVHRLHVLEYVAGPIGQVSAYTDTLESQKIAPDTQSDYERVDDESDDFCISQLRFVGGGYGQLLIVRGLHGDPLDQPMVTAYYGSSGSVIGPVLTGRNGEQQDVIELLEREADQGLLESWFPMGIEHEFGLQFANFLDAIASDGKRRPECDGRQGLRDLALAYAQLESNAAGRPVDPDEVIAKQAYAYQAPIDAALGIS